MSVNKVETYQEVLCIANHLRWKSFVILAVHSVIRETFPVKQPVQ